MDNLRRFILVITIFLFVSAAIAGYSLSLGYGSLSKDHEIDLSVDANPYDPDQTNEDTIKFKGNILFIVGQENRPETDVLFVTNYDSNINRLSILYIPKDLKVTDSDLQETTAIGKYLSNYSAKEAAAIVSSLLDIGINYYIHLNDTNFIKLINMFGTVNFEMPVSISYKDSYYDIDLTKGDKVFDGRMALYLNQFYRTSDDYYTQELLEFYNGKDINRIKMVDRFFNAFLVQKIKENSDDYYFNLLSVLLPDCDTNISEEALKMMTETLDLLNHSNTKSYAITGKENPDVRPYIVYDNVFIDLASGLNVSSRDILANRFAP